ncbi:MAG: GMP synthase subunit A [Thermoplasmatales archaeon]|nr:MAG: GMP synthase subunit A [Thermoplasmatales archaeon]
MVKIFVVDNGGQWTHREWRVLKYLDVETKIVPNTASFLEVSDVDGLVLSGGAPRIAIEGNLGNCSEFLEKANYPILGICAGHQFMAQYFGGRTEPSKIPEFGKVELTRLCDDDILFENVPKKSIVWLSHNDEVTKVPDGFDVLGESENCKVQAIQHKSRPLFGLQFHPEVEHTEYGEHIFKNFVKNCKK